MDSHSSTSDNAAFLEHPISSFLEKSWRTVFLTKHFVKHNADVRSVYSMRWPSVGTRKFVLSFRLIVGTAAGFVSDADCVFATGGNSERGN
jgi:hypothetical protein